MMNKMEKDMMGVRIIINTVNFQLIKNRKKRLPKNCNKFLSSIDRLSDAALSTTVTSLVNLEISSPVLFLS